MKTKVRRIIHQVIQQMNHYLIDKIPIEEIETVNLFGESGILDSISLVKLIVLLEEELETEFEIPILLANEKAMSQKNSPFANVNTLTNYIAQLVEENHHA